LSLTILFLAMLSTSERGDLTLPPLESPAAVQNLASPKKLLKTDNINDRRFAS
jgi:hypothetical protein